MKKYKNISRVMRSSILFSSKVLFHLAFVFYCFLVRIKLHVSYTTHTHIVHPYTYLYVVSFPRVYLRVYIYICKCDLKKTIKIGRQHSYILYNSIRNIKLKEIFFRQTVHTKRRNTCV